MSYLSGRKSAEPRINSAVYGSPFRQMDDQKLIDSNKRVTKSVAVFPVPSQNYSREQTPDKFSLINYDRLPSARILRRLGELSTERQSQQNVYVTGKIVTQNDLDGAEMTESDSDAGHAVCGDIVLGDTTADLLTAERIAACMDALYADETSDDVGQSGEVVEELAEENKSLLWFLVKQVRPGMDLSKVVLPTFILEPRSFLDKLADSFYHADILSNAWRHQDPFDRMKTVVRWYLSGLYRKPRGLKKPYNPVLGETFRCCWKHPQSNTYTYYVAEQVSHHPPISAFYVSNRKEGFAIEASILAKSKFYGNSTSAILEGVARLTLLPLAETYYCTSPYAHCKGLLLGTLSMELGGRVTISCPATNYSADIEFRLKPFLGGADSINMVSGRIRHNKDTLATIEGHWDGRIDIKDRRSQEDSVLLDVAELKARRLRRRLVQSRHLGEFESQRLWQKVSLGIANEDQVAATCEKTIIEEAQRERARGLGVAEWVPRYFKKTPSAEGSQLSSVPGLESANTANTWQYMYPNMTPWDDSVDILEYESEFMMKTLQRQPAGAPASSSLQPLQHLEMEHTGSESDSTNSHHHRTPSQGQQTVTAALLRVEAALREQGAELAGVKAMVRRLEAPGVRTGQHNSLMVSAVVLVLAILLQNMLWWAFGR